MQRDQKQLGDDVRKEVEEQLTELLTEELQLVGGGDTSDAVY